MNTCVKIFVAGISLIFGTHLAYTFFNKKKNQIRNELHDVIMFSHNSDLQKSKYSRILISQSLHQVLYYLSTPRHNLDVCMYVFTNPDFSYAVLKLHLKGVKIRVIIDADMAYSTGSQTRKLEKQGIPVRWMKCTALMHHKFLLLDTLTDSTMSTPLVMAGSLNWTSQATGSNFEDVLITSQEDIVKKYKDEFERLWVMFKPIVK